MTPNHLDRVLAIARSLKDAPQWPLAAYVAAIDPLGVPARIALVAAKAPACGIVGFAVASLLGPQSELEIIAVAAKQQRRGLARQLFSAMAEELRRAQVTEVILEVRASNRPALALYSALGFVETGRRPRYYADPIEDALQLALSLT